MGGPCCRSGAYSTSHAIIVDDAMYKYKYIPKREDDENHMLDLAFGPREAYIFPPGRISSKM